MKEKIKENISFIFCVALGFFNCVFFALPYLTSFATLKHTGFSVMLDWWGEGFVGVMCSLLQIFALVCSAFMIILGVFGMMKVFEGYKGLGRIDNKKIAKISLLALAVINVLLLVFLIILVSSLPTNADLGYELSAGIYLSCSFSVVLTIALLFLEKRFKKK